MDRILVLLSAFVFFNSPAAILLRFFLHYYTYLLFCIKYKNKHLSLFSDNIPKNSSTLSFHIAPVSIAFRISFFLLWSEIINSVVTTWLKHVLTFNRDNLCLSNVPESPPECGIFYFYKIILIKIFNIRIDIPPKYSDNALIRVTVKRLLHDFYFRILPHSPRVWSFLFIAILSCVAVESCKLLESTYIFLRFPWYSHSLFNCGIFVFYFLYFRNLRK